jgi:hypothetical protein
VEVRLELHQLLEQMVLTLFFHLLLLQAVEVAVEVTHLVKVAVVVLEAVLVGMLLAPLKQGKGLLAKVMQVELLVLLMAQAVAVVLELLV